MITALEVAFWVVLVAIAAGLVWGFVRSRNAGYLLLLFALPGWALLERALRPIFQDQFERVSRGQDPAFPYSLLGHESLGDIVAQYSFSFRLVQSVLFLIGVILLAMHSTRPAPPQPPTP